MVKGILLGALGFCLALGMILVLAMPQTTSRLYYQTLGEGIRYSAIPPVKPFSLSGKSEMPVAIDILNTAASDRIYASCPLPNLVQPFVYTAEMEEVPLAEAWRSSFESRTADCKDITIHAGQHQSVIIDVHSIFEIHDPGDYYLSFGAAGETHDQQMANPKILFQVTQ